MEYYSAIKKNETLPFAMIWMELEFAMLSKISESEKRQTPHDFTHMWNLSNKTDEYIKRREKKRGKQTRRDS